MDDRQTVFDKLAKQVRHLEISGRKTSAGSRPLSSGCQAMDRHLPGGGYQGGTIVEYLRSQPACGANYLALSAARHAMNANQRFLVVVDLAQQFYPPAAVAMGIDLQRLVLVRPKSAADALWAIDQSLRCSAVAAVMAEVDQMDDRAARRVQLAAEQGGGLGLLVRGSSARSQPSWAEVQWIVRPLHCESADDGHNKYPHSVAASRQVHLQLIRARGGRAGANVYIEIDSMQGELREVVRHEQKAAMHLAAQLAHPARSSNSTRSGESGTGSAIA